MFRLRLPLGCSLARFHDIAVTDTAVLELPSLVTRRLRRVEIRSTPELGDGTFTALVADYTSDAYPVGNGFSERLLPGCFAEFCASQQRSQTRTPVNWEHDWKAGPVGSAVVSETPAGLIAQGQLYIGLSERARVIYQAMLDGAIQEWSVGFMALAFRNNPAEPRCETVAKGDLLEFSACHRGLNPGTSTLDLRSLPIAEFEGSPEEAEREVIRIRSAFTPLEDPASTEEPVVTIDPKPEVPVEVARSIGRLRTTRAKVAKLRAVDDDSDVSPADLAQSIDALIDAIDVALDGGDIKGAQDLVTAADSTSDDLLEMLGVPDDDGIEDLLDSLLGVGWADVSPAGPGDADMRSAADSEGVRTLLSTRAGWELFAAQRRAASTTEPSDQ